MPEVPKDTVIVSKQEIRQLSIDGFWEGWEACYEMIEVIVDGMIKIGMNPTPRRILGRLDSARTKMKNNEDEQDFIKTGKIKET